MAILERRLGEALFVRRRRPLQPMPLYNALVNHLKASNGLTELTHAVVFSKRQANEISALPLKLDHLRRVIGLLRSNQMANTPAVDRFAIYMRGRFDEMKDLIRRPEQIVVWGGGSW